MNKTPCEKVLLAFCPTTEGMTLAGYALRTYAFEPEGVPSQMHYCAIDGHSLEDSRSFLFMVAPQGTKCPKSLDVLAHGADGLKSEDT